VHARLKAGNYVAARLDLESATTIVNTLPKSRDKAFDQLSLGRLTRTLYQREKEWRSDLLPLARETFETVARSAKEKGWLTVQSYAYGYLGGLYEESDQHEIALRLTRSAIFLSQQAQARESIHLWYWQLGRIQRSQGQPEAAIGAYQLAVESLQKVRLELEFGTRLRGKTFREVSAPMYFELADLLLQHPSPDSVEKGEQNRLFEARKTIELLKAAELEDYFQDNCVVQLQERTGDLDVIIGPKTAVLYLIPLETRLELLVSLSSGIQRFTVQVSSAELDRQVLEFRNRLETRTDRRYLRNAWQLYDWIIRPIDGLLTDEQVDTLVLVPYGALTTIPLSALNDRNRKSFLIERYAVATTPGLKLTDPGRLRRDGVDVLVAGLSKGVQGFSPLPYVPDELRGIERIFGGTTLEDENFLAQNLNRELSNKSYTIVHIASHAQFDSDPNKTFLLTYDRKFDLDEVQRLIGFSEFRTRPVELLTLSACETEAGDEKAALGLAGVAVKSGARSALATLWAVNDEAASLVIIAFYEQLKTRNISKAQALRKAQIEMLQDPRYRHPAYWAPYLLIGNWQ
jgi:CHAT domain-containing protein